MNSLTSETVLAPVHRRKRLFGPPVVDFRRRNRNVLVGLGDGGKIENLPLLGLACDKAGKVIQRLASELAPSGLRGSSMMMIDRSMCPRQMSPAGSRAR